MVRKIIERIAKKYKGEDYSIDDSIPLTYLVSYASNRFMMLVRGILKTIGLKKRGKKTFVGKKVCLKCKSRMTFGDNISIHDDVYIDALSQNGIKLGDSCSIGKGTVIRCSGNYRKLGVGFFIGNNSSLADNCFVGASGGVWIGNDVIGGQNIRFHSSNHQFSDLNTPIRKQGVSLKGIHIGNNCWIGAGAVFCDGVTIGDGCVIGANAVVTKSFPDNCVIAGCPAKVIKTRV